MNSLYASLHPTLQGVLAHRLGWDGLRPVQEETIRAAAEGGDLLVVAGTAGGKTEAALIPVLDAILKGGLAGVCCICISPLKALINDQEERISAICVPAGVTVGKWHGDVPKGERTWGEGDPPHILVTTPESLEVILQDHRLRGDLERLRYVVIDEVHAFAGDQRGVQMRCLCDRLDMIATRPLRRIGLSATIGNPGEVLDWLSGPGRKRRLVAVPPVPGKKRFSFAVSGREGRARAVANLVRGKHALVFVGSRSDAEGLCASMDGLVEHLTVHHSSLSPGVRQAAEESLAGPDPACVICTSTLELGIDIGGLDIVVQAGPPPSVSSFLQRLGRTGRRGGPAIMAFVLDNDLDLMVAVATVEAAMQREVEPLRPPSLPYTVFVQQLLLFLMGRRRVGRQVLLSSLLSLSPFSGFRREDCDAILAALIEDGYLVEDGGFLMLGPAAERGPARSGGRDLLSIFAAGGSWRALTPDGEEAGSLDGRFVAGGTGTVCTLGGRRWRIISLDPAHRIATVVGEGGRRRSSDRRPFWSGSGAPMSRSVAGSVGRILAAGCSPLPLAPPESAAIRGIAEEIGHPFAGDGFVVSERPEGVFVLSCHGGRFNRTLATVLGTELGDGPRIRSGDLWLLISGITGPHPALEVCDAIRRVKGWTPARIAGVLPLLDAEEWKFGTLLPPHLFSGMIRADVDGVDDFVTVLQACGIAGPGENISLPGPQPMSK
ncbi:DEAD/DEAH box helicase [Methanofollis fontis]|uniref:DEAD/DEAH box helicase n=1 Tax=Methanofollis fontis TaxID=2052832 RepID=A0A483CR80_9EURY|nr:DEAD/DEAH box helicase [Methanofollis fontis]TAJ45318.1 DEAD/DEAH box helicase [Methanofollis fontis]